jgi:uncharacterized protein (TIGR03086 family)
MDEAAAFRRASDGFLQRARQIKDEQWMAFTPCTEWTVRALVNHVAGEYFWVPEMIAGRTIADVGDRLDGDLLGESPLQSLIDAQRTALAAVDGPGALQTTVHLSYGDLPATAYVKQMALDSVLHTWDLARAIGSDETLDPDLLDMSYEELRNTAEDWRSAGAFGPQTPAADASTQAKLLALSGR